MLSLCDGVLRINWMTKYVVTLLVYIARWSKKLFFLLLVESYNVKSQLFITRMLNFCK